MSKKTNQNPSNPSVSWGWGIIVSEDTQDHLIGRLLTLIEAMGLSDKQEKSAMDLIKQEVRSAFSSDSINSSSKYLPPGLHDSIRECLQELKQIKIPNGMPPSLGNYKFKITIEK